MLPEAPCFLHWKDGGSVLGAGAFLLLGDPFPHCINGCNFLGPTGEGDRMRVLPVQLELKLGLGQQQMEEKHKDRKTRGRIPSHREDNRKAPLGHHLVPSDSCLLALGPRILSPSKAF